MLWRPNICFGGQCEFEWNLGDNWNPIGPFKFNKICQAHSIYINDLDRLDGLKKENQAMSSGRVAIASIISLKKDDGSDDSSGSTIDFSFDINRKIIYKLPNSISLNITTKKAINDALTAINPLIFVKV